MTFTANLIADVTRERYTHFTTGMSLSNKQLCKATGSSLSNRGYISVADPGFLNPDFGAKTIILQEFCRKLHENERNRTEGGGPANAQDVRV